MIIQDCHKLGSPSLPSVTTTILVESKQSKLLVGCNFPTIQISPLKELANETTKMDRQINTNVSASADTGQETAALKERPNICIEMPSPASTSRARQQQKKELTPENGETVKMPIMWLLSQDYEDSKMM